MKKELNIDANRQQDAAEVLMVILKHLGLDDIRQNQAIESRRCTKCDTARMSDLVYSHIPLNISSNVKNFNFRLSQPLIRFKKNTRFKIHSIHGKPKFWRARVVMALLQWLL